MRVCEGGCRGKGVSFTLRRAYLRYVHRDDITLLRTFSIERRSLVRRSRAPIVPRIRIRRRTPSSVCTTTCRRRGPRELISGPKTSVGRFRPGQTTVSIRCYSLRQVVTIRSFRGVSSIARRCVLVGPHVPTHRYVHSMAAIPFAYFSDTGLSAQLCAYIRSNRWSQS